MLNKKLLTILVLSVFLISFINALVYQTPGAVTNEDTESIIDGTSLNETIDSYSETTSESNLWLLVIVVGIFAFVFIVVRVLKIAKKKKLEPKNIEVKEEPTDEEDSEEDSEEINEFIGDLDLEDNEKEIKGDTNLNGQPQSIDENTTEKEEPTNEQ